MKKRNDGDPGVRSARICYHGPMAIFMRIVIGLVVVLFGLFCTIKSELILDILGPIDFAEEKLGSGGTRLFYKLFGSFVVIIGFLVMTNLWNAFLGATLGSIVPGGKA